MHNQTAQSQRHRKHTILPALARQQNRKPKTNPPGPRLHTRPPQKRKLLLRHRQNPRIPPLQRNQKTRPNRRRKIRQQMHPQLHNPMNKKLQRRTPKTPPSQRKSTQVNTKRTNKNKTIVRRTICPVPHGRQTISDDQRQSTYPTGVGRVHAHWHASRQLPQ